MTEDNPTQSAHQYGSDRRSFLKWAGASAGTVAFASSVGTSLLTGGGDGSAAGDFQLHVLDYIDRTYVLGATTVAGEPIRLRDGLTLELDGAADITEDPFTGKILLRPRAGESLSGRAVLKPNTVAHDRYFVGRGTVASDHREIGYDASGVPDTQTIFAANGGGACQSAASGASLLRLLSLNADKITPERKGILQAIGMSEKSEITTNLRVRALIQGTVIPKRPHERQINWQHARYYGEHDAIGQMRFTYRPEKDSILTMRGGPGSFFPARSENCLYCRLELLELGGAAILHNPMRFPQESMTWPPYSTPMNLAEPVTFYDEQDPTQEVLTIHHNELELYDYNGVSIEQEHHSIDHSGNLVASFTVRNQTTAPFRGRSILIGDHKDYSFSRTDSELVLSPGGTKGDTRSIEVKAPVGKSLLTQTVSFGVMSLSDPVALGVSSIRFRHGDLRDTFGV